MNEKKVNLELTVTQLNVVMMGVVKVSIEQGLDTFNTIQQQAKQQLGEPNVSTAPLASKVIN